MRVYRADVGGPVRYLRTLQEVRGWCRGLLKELRVEARIELRDYPVSHTTVVGLFNGALPEGELLLRWRLNNRGALRPMELTEE